MGFSATGNSEGSKILAEFVSYSLDNGSKVVFETDDPSLVSQRGGPPQLLDGGELEQRVTPIAEAAEILSRGLRQKLAPDEIELTLGVKISGKMGWWFVASTAGEAAISVTLRWKAPDNGTELATGSTDS
jgi:hypothetical protein